MHIMVSGNREWRGGALGGKTTAPMPFDCMPLTFERAFGGYHPTGSHGPSPDDTDHEPRNPAGQGFVSRGKELPDRVSLPNLEDPRERFVRPGDRPTPISPGPVAPFWLPRRAFVGTYDARWEATRAPFLPFDFDTRHLQVAHPKLIQAGYLSGGERVELANVMPWPRLSFGLPTCRLRVTAGVAGERHALLPRMETVSLTPAEGRCELLWRATLPVDKRPLEVEHVDVDLQHIDTGPIVRGVA